ncbi:hypothetical protein ACFFX0_16370 [Citricoccus parietis]|uniref:Uncharacterized protein n=1 Tax=Citricoccus parietis TaxID=592307 RepID=A0ABV5G175_9MICC
MLPGGMLHGNRTKAVIPGLGHRDHVLPPGWQIARGPHHEGSGMPPNLM